MDNQEYTNEAIKKLYQEEISSIPELLAKILQKVDLFMGGTINQKEFFQYLYVVSILKLENMSKKNESNKKYAEILK